MSYSSALNQLPTRKSLYDMQNRNERLAVDCEYKATTKNRDRFASASTVNNMDR